MKDKIILLVEDNEQDELLTIRALRKQNIHNEIVVVRDGASALDFLFARGQYEGRDTSIQPQIVLLDLKIPKLSGLEVLRAIRADNDLKRLPVIVLTTSKEDRDLVTSYNLGANAYVRKPVDFIEFVGAVRTLGLFWLVINQSPPTGEVI